MKHIFVLVFLLSSVFASAQERHLMNLEECMAYAIDNSYKTQQQASLTKNAALDFTGTWLQQLPSLSSNVSASGNFGRGIDPATNSYINTQTFNNSLGVSASLPVFSGMRYLNRTLSAKVAKLRGEEQLRLTRDDVAEATMISYAEVVYNGELLELCEQRVESYTNQELLMSRKCELGVGSEADLAQIRATLAGEEYKAISARNTLEISILNLKDRMNYPINDTLIIEPIIEEAQLFAPEQLTGELVEYAADFNPSAVIGKHAFDISNYDLKIARGAYYPSISFNGGISTNYYTNLGGSGPAANPWGSQLGSNLGQFAQLSMSIPIFDGLSTRLKVRKAKNNFEQAQRDLDQTLRELQSAIEQAVMELDATYKQWRQGRRTVDYQRIANEAARRKYEQGMLSIIELQTSDDQLFSSEIELRNAYLRHQIKVREVNYYKGIPYVSVAQNL